MSDSVLGEECCAAACVIAVLTHNLGRLSLESLYVQRAIGALFLGQRRMCVVCVVTESSYCMQPTGFSTQLRFTLVFFVIFVQLVLHSQTHFYFC